MTSKRIRIGTRGSELALWQANKTSALLRDAGYEPELHIVKTTGDKRTDVSLAAIGGKGLFIKELEEALERGDVDVAVHSLKDVPSIIPEQFVLAGFLERADPRDAWVHVDGRAIADLEPGTTIGTSAPRRRAQLAELYPHLQLENIRGNVESRIQKARDGLYGGLVLASAGLHRLGRSDEITSTFTIDEMLPAAGQGIITLECLRTNSAMRDIIRAVNHETTERAARTERDLLERFGTRLDCYSAVAVYFDGSVLRSFFSNGTRSIRAHGPSVDDV
jgi:hydroxymethylbilane synthase